MSPHTLYTGVSQSGKTTLARMMARALAAKGHRVIVYDPMGTATAGGGWPEKAIVFDDAIDFLNYVHSPEGFHAHLFVDEGHEIFGHGEEFRENYWLFTKGRHYGLHLHIMTQRPTKLHPDVRSQCGRCYMFRLAVDDVKLIGNDYGFSEIHKINLDKGDFLVLNSGTSSFQRGNVFALVQPS